MPLPCFPSTATSFLFLSEVAALSYLCFVCPFLFFTSMNHGEWDGRFGIGGDKGLKWWLLVKWLIYFAFFFCYLNFKFWNLNFDLYFFKFWFLFFYLWTHYPCLKYNVYEIWFELVVDSWDVGFSVWFGGFLLVCDCCAVFGWFIIYAYILNSDCFCTNEHSENRKLTQLNQI